MRPALSNERESANGTHHSQELVERGGIGRDKRLDTKNVAEAVSKSQPMVGSGTTRTEMLSTFMLGFLVGAFSSQKVIWLKLVVLLLVSGTPLNCIAGWPNGVRLPE